MSDVSDPALAASQPADAVLGKRRPRGSGWRGLVLLLACLLWLTSPGVTMAQSVWSASDQDDVWVVLAEADKGLTILHRKAADAPEHYWRVATLPGLLAPGGLTAGEDRLWLVYRNLIVQSVEHGLANQAGAMRHRQMQFWPSLPEGTQLRSLAATGQTLWALVDVRTAEALATIESWSSRPSASQPASQPATHPATQPDTQPAATQASEEGEPFESRAMLLVMRMGRWSAVDLPQPWSDDQRAWLVFTQASQA